MQFRTHWKSWGGAAVGALAADYAQNRMKSLIASQSNGRLVSFGLVAADALGWGQRYTEYLHGAADWAVGDLARTFLAARIGAAAPVVTVAATPAATAAPASTATSANGLAGVPAADTSAAFNNPSTGY
jgi:cytochrome c1